MHRPPIILLAVTLACQWITESRADFSDFRALFVNRFEYDYSSSSINTIMRNAADLGITDIMFQVRGRADAFYNSHFEPRAYGLPDSFDPLQAAIDSGHARGIKVHAWINATPMWNTTSLNPPSGHIYHNTNPSFRLMDIDGNTEPQDGWSNYSSVNPVLPEVHAHINNVVQDIATNYEVDGIHLDYIRYLPAPTSTSFDRLPHDEISHQMFTAATGLDGSNPANVASYRNYIEGRITDLVAGIKQTVDTAETATNRTIEFTASVWRDPDIWGATLGDGDADGDGDVDGQDFLIWQQSTNPVSGATNASAIPEPATWILFVVACLFPNGRFRRR